MATTWLYNPGRPCCINLDCGVPIFPGQSPPQWIWDYMTTRTNSIPNLGERQLHPRFDRSAVKTYWTGEATVDRPDVITIGMDGVPVSIGPGKTRFAYFVRGTNSDGFILQRVYLTAFIAKQPDGNPWGDPGKITQGYLSDDSPVLKLPKTPVGGSPFDFEAVDQEYHPTGAGGPWCGVSVQSDEVFFPGIQERLRTTPPSPSPFSMTFNTAYRAAAGSTVTIRGSNYVVASTPSTLVQTTVVNTRVKTTTQCCQPWCRSCGCYLDYVASFGDGSRNLPMMNLGGGYRGWTAFHSIHFPSPLNVYSGNYSFTVDFTCRNDGLSALSLSFLIDHRSLIYQATSTDDPSSGSVVFSLTPATFQGLAVDPPVSSITVFTKKTGLKPADCGNYPIPRGLKPTVSWENSITGPSSEKTSELIPLGKPLPDVLSMNKSPIAVRIGLSSDLYGIRVSFLQKNIEGVHQSLKTIVFPYYGANNPSAYGSPPPGGAVVVDESDYRVKVPDPSAPLGYWIRQGPNLDSVNRTHYRSGIPLLMTLNLAPTSSDRFPREGQEWLKYLLSCGFTKFTVTS